MPDPVQTDPHSGPHRLRRARAAALSWRAARPQAARARAGRIDRARVRKAWEATKAFLARHYAAIVIVGALTVSLGALLIGLWRVPFLVNALLDDLQADARDPDATRGTVVALAAVLSAIAILGTLIAQAIRVWTSERQTRTLEQGHVTDRLIRAIEQLGAEKTVKRMEKDAEGADIRDAEGRLRVVEATVPNLEVRLGALYAVERIAQDSERDHITIMEILCAYIRENAKAAEAPPNPLGDLPEQEPSDREERNRLLQSRSKSLAAWLGNQPRPRMDVQASLTVLGRRSEARRRLERQKGFRLDLSDTNLRKADLTDGHFEAANFTGARFEGAALKKAQFEAADFQKARLDGANLGEAQLTGAHLGGVCLERAVLSHAILVQAILFCAKLENTDLRSARLERANLSGARLEGADLGSAGMEGANLRMANLEGADFSGTRLTGANLSEARLERTNLIGAQLEACDLSAARMAGANLSNARMQRSDLRSARLEGATLSRARLEQARLGGARLKGADLRSADFRGADWGGVPIRAALAHFADLRTTGMLLQSQLEQVIGDRFTLLPDRMNENGEPYHVWSCWETPPPDFDAILAAADPFADEAEREDLRRRFLCGPDNPRRKTGAPLSLDASYPEGHPLAPPDDQHLLKSDERP